MNYKNLTALAFLFAIICAGCTDRSNEAPSSGLNGNTPGAPSGESKDLSLDDADNTPTDLRVSGATNTSTDMRTNPPSAANPGPEF